MEIDSVDNERLRATRQTLRETGFLYSTESTWRSEFRLRDPELVMILSVIDALNYELGGYEITQPMSQFYESESRYFNLDRLLDPRENEPWLRRFQLGQRGCWFQPTQFTLDALEVGIPQAAHGVLHAVAAQIAADYFRLDPGVFYSGQYRGPLGTSSAVDVLGSNDRLPLYAAEIIMDERYLDAKYLIRRYDALADFNESGATILWVVRNREIGYSIYRTLVNHDRLVFPSYISASSGPLDWLASHISPPEGYVGAAGLDTEFPAGLHQMCTIHQLWSALDEQDLSFLNPTTV